MTEALIDRVIKVCQDETYDKQAKSAILKELLRLFHVNEMQWMRVNPSQKNGKYMPEGQDVVMFSEKSGQMWIDHRYSSCPKNFSDKGGVSHWMHLPEKPTE